VKKADEGVGLINVSTGFAYYLNLLLIIFTAFILLMIVLGKLELDDDYKSIANVFRTKVTEDNNDSTTKMTKKYCSQCGTELLGTDAFCPQCGYKCEEVFETPKESVAESSASKTTLESLKEWCKKNKKLVVAGIVVLAICIAFGIYKYIDNYSKKTLDFIRNFAHNYNACAVSKGTYLTMSWN
jgi:uncharacterized OB-fold protein